MRPPGSVRAARRCRCRWPRSRRSRCGTTPPGRGIRTVICTCRSTPACYAEGSWRGLHTVGVRDSLDAINGIGHAAVMTDPGFRAGARRARLHPRPRLRRGRRSWPEFVGPFSARAAQIGRNIDRYEADWRAANPGREPGPGLRRAWDARAWADARPDKILPRDGAELTQRWVERTARARLPRPSSRGSASTRHRSANSTAHRAVAEVLSRLAARRSGWNAADIRGEVEQLIARRNIVTDAAVRGRAGRGSDRPHARRVRAAAGPGRGARARPGAHLPARSRRRSRPHRTPRRPRRTLPVDGRRHSCPSTVHAPGWTRRNVRSSPRSPVTAALLVVEGAAGAGKTTTLAAARAAIEQRGAPADGGDADVQGRPRRRRSRSERARPLRRGWPISTATDGTRTALGPGSHRGQLDPHTGVVFVGPSEAAALRRGDLLLVDEAGMLDQDTARALLTIADEHHARVALVGDRHQLPAVGRGGVLDLAARWAAPGGVPDAGHRAPLHPHHHRRGRCGQRPSRTGSTRSSAWRCAPATDPEEVFDALLAREQIRVHPNDS